MLTFSEYSLMTPRLQLCMYTLLTSQLERGSDNERKREKTKEDPVPEVVT